MAATALRDLPARLLARGWKNPVIPIWADAIEALIAVGESERAREYVEPYELHARRLGCRSGLAGAARCRGLLAAAEGDLDSAFASYQDALGVLRDFTFPFEHGRVLLNLGSAHRQAKQKRAAREALEHALTIFEELGARPWAEKAQAELRRISGRKPVPEALTETEGRVARLAAQGHSNKEIASALFMSVHTVEAHLTHADENVKWP